MTIYGHFSIYDLYIFTFFRSICKLCCIQGSLSVKSVIKKFVCRLIRYIFKGDHSILEVVELSSFQTSFQRNLFPL